MDHRLTCYATNEMPRWDGGQMEIYSQPLYADGDSRITFTFTNIRLASEKNRIRIESKRTTDLCTFDTENATWGI